MNPASGLVTTEGGGTASFTVVLNTQPTANVTIASVEQRHDRGDGESREPDLHDRGLEHRADGDASPGWTTRSRTATSPTRSSPASATSGDPGYNGLDPADVSVTNTDDEPPPGITVSPVTGLVTTEAGGTATFTVVLNTQPTANVTIGLSSSDTTEGTVSPATLTFTTANWNTAQTVTVTGVNDAFADGNQLYSIVTAPPAAAMPATTGSIPRMCR